MKHIITGPREPPNSIATNCVISSHTDQQVVADGSRPTLAQILQGPGAATVDAKALSVTVIVVV